MGERNVGIEGLRIFSMLLIIIGHIVAQGGILRSVLPLSSQWYMAWFLYIFALPAVNCYALISGYVGIDSEFKIKRIAKLWLQVFFYTSILYVIFKIFYPNVLSKLLVLQAFAPVTYNAYWYISSYFGLFFIIPFINKGIKDLDVKFLKDILFIILIIYVITPFLNFRDPYLFNRGYSAYWLLFLYIIGGVAKRLKIKNIVTKKASLSIFFVTTILNYVFIVLTTMVLSDNKVLDKYVWSIASYVNPLVLLSAIALLMLFVNMRINNKTIIKSIGLIAPASLGVYLIHVNQLIWQNFIKNCAVSFIHYSPVGLCTKVLIISIFIYIVCSLIDLFRMYIFNKIQLDRFLEDFPREKAKL